MIGLLFLAILVPTVAVAVYLNALWHSGFWRRRGIKGPKSLPFIGNLKQTFGDCQRVLPLQYAQWTKEYGSVYGIQRGRVNILVVSDAEMLQEIFVKNFDCFYGRTLPPSHGNVDVDEIINIFLARGERWKRLRTITNPVFSVKNFKRVMPLMIDSVNKMMTFMDTSYQAGKPFNIHRNFHELTIDIIYRVALGQRESKQFNNEAANQIIEIFARGNNNNFEYISWIFPWLGNAIKFVDMGTSKLRGDPFWTMISELIVVVNQRNVEFEKKGGASADDSRFTDFIDMFLELQTDDEVIHNQTDVFERSSSKVTKKLTINEIVAQCIIFLLAGSDTSSNTLGFLAHLLVKNPKVQLEIQEEIDSICTDEEPTFEQLGKMKYTEAVIKESLRLFPVATSVIARDCSKTTTVCGYEIEKGMSVQADLITMQRSKQIWGEDADDFRPERWQNEEIKNKFAWAAFGIGPRVCVGMRMAIIEMKLALINILRKYNLRECAETEVEPKLMGHIVFSPKSVTVKLEKRINI